MSNVPNGLPLVWCPQPTSNDSTRQGLESRGMDGAGVVRTFGDGEPAQISSVPWWSSGKGISFRTGGFLARNQILLKIPRVCGPVGRSIRRIGSIALPLVWCGSLERMVAVQVSSSSSDDLPK
ncbi:hypothetical protein AVEN_66542-1 [Araneus ventricosus]|uniref:Uncharacterized protein n=1 Tax=Araneus ventricosus TaxID=182803 RepID=A0A4Y2EAW0_ARAVE|nr:hypothetical protein AVEN_66542-1 [Araneus ventricosus]